MHLFWFRLYSLTVTVITKMHFDAVVCCNSHTFRAMTVRAVHYHVYSLICNVMNDNRIFWPHLSHLSVDLCSMEAAILFAMHVGKFILFFFYVYLGNTEINGKCRMASLCVHRDTTANRDKQKRSRVHTVGKQWWHMYHSELS